MNIPYLDLTRQMEALEPQLTEGIQSVLKSCQFILGGAVESCEKKLAEFVGSPYAVTAASGTDALIMALMAGGVKPGDEVLTTSFSFFATAEVITLLGATPIFVDIEPDTFNIDTELVKKHMSNKTKAIIPVSLYGQIANMDEINQLAQENEIMVIEDAAQSFGATYKGKRSCNLSRFGCTSFFPAKPLGCYGDGGAVFCQSEEDYEVLKQVRHHGQTGRYHHTRLGINGRMDAIQCAIIEIKLGRYAWEIEQRQRIAGVYSRELSGISSLRIPVVRDDRDSVWAQYTLASEKREAWIGALKELGVPTSIHYPKGLHQQPAMTAFKPDYALPITETSGEQVFSIPLYADMSQEHVDHVVSSFKKIGKNL